MKIREKMGTYPAGGRCVLIAASLDFQCAAKEWIFVECPARLVGVRRVCVVNESKALLEVEAGETAEASEQAVQVPLRRAIRDATDEQPRHDPAAKEFTN
jgi:hypothetical protein